MEATQLMEIIKTNLDDNFIITSPTLYDPDKLQYKVSIAVLEKKDDVYIKKFTITVDDNTKK